jgi:SAM-dependent methyltransferase
MTAFASRRSTESEWLDDPSFGNAALRAAVLADLARLNRWTGAHRPVLQFLRRTWPATVGRPLTVLDAGCGHGDLLREVHALALRTGRTVRCIGLDASPEAVAAARAATPAGAPIRFKAIDLFDWHTPVDYVVSAQVSHHLDDAPWAAFLRWADANARRGWCITDLRRSTVARIGFPWLARAAGLHPVVRHDGRVSIARSRTPAEWRALRDALGLRHAVVRTHGPWRMSIATEAAR